MKDTDKDQIWNAVLQGHKKLFPEAHAEELIKAHECIYGKNKEDKNTDDGIRLSKFCQNEIKFY